jgi:hypothetical protein
MDGEVLSQVKVDFTGLGLEPGPVLAWPMDPWPLMRRLLAAAACVSALLLSSCSKEPLPFLADPSYPLVSGPALLDAARAESGARGFDLRLATGEPGGASGLYALMDSLKPRVALLSPLAAREAEALQRAYPRCFFALPDSAGLSAPASLGPRVASADADMERGYRALGGAIARYLGQWRRYTPGLGAALCALSGGEAERARREAWVREGYAAALGLGEALSFDALPDQADRAQTDAFLSRNRGRDLVIAYFDESPATFDLLSASPWPGCRFIVRDSRGVGDAALFTDAVLYYLRNDYRAQVRAALGAALESRAGTQLVPPRFEPGPALSLAGLGGVSARDTLGLE